MPYQIVLLGDDPRLLRLKATGELAIAAAQAIDTLEARLRTETAPEDVELMRFFNRLNLPVASSRLRYGAYLLGQEITAIKDYNKIVAESKAAQAKRDEFERVRAIKETIPLFDDDCTEEKER